MKNKNSQNPDQGSKWMALSGIGAATIAACATILVGYWQSNNKPEKSTNCGIRIVNEVTRNAVPNATVTLEEVGKVNTPKITDSTGYVYFACPEKPESTLIIRSIGYQEYRKFVDLKPESEILTISIIPDKQTSLQENYFNIKSTEKDHILLEQESRIEKNDQSALAPKLDTNSGASIATQYRTRDVGDGFVSVRSSPTKGSAEIKRIPAGILITCRAEEVQGESLWRGNMWRFCDDFGGYIYSQLLSPD